jgi:hypothetical protein
VLSAFVSCKSFGSAAGLFFSEVTLFEQADVKEIKSKT